MGSGQTKLNYRNAFVELTSKTQPIDANNEEFWDQFWSDYPTKISDMFVLVPAEEIRALRDDSPSNLATLCYKAIERLNQIAEASFPTTQDQQTALNCIRLLTRIIPYIFEEQEWRSFFWSSLPPQADSSADAVDSVPLAQTLIASLCDLLFCPDFTVHSLTKSGPENAEDMHTIDSCEYIWESGVGFAQSPPANAQHNSNRTEILRLLLVCFSETMYLGQAEARSTTNRWIKFFTGPENRHVLPLFTSLLNIVCSYNPSSSSLPYNHLVFTDSREPLVEAALQILCVALEIQGKLTDPVDDRLSEDGSSRQQVQSVDGESTVTEGVSGVNSGDAIYSNLFVNYMSRIHRDEDFLFILNGLTRLLTNPLTQTYLPGSAKKVQMHQELLILFWRTCDINRKFMFYVLKSSHVLDILVPILYHINAARADKSQLGMIHIGVFIILLLSGERNFGVRLNKPYTNRVHMDISVFNGNHADLLIIVFHKIITTGHQCLQPLFDCLITIIDNISPYMKSLSMVSATKLIHLTEAFSQPWFLLAAPNNYQLVLFLLEIFNNIIQYQFDGNSSLVYSIIRKRQIFYQLTNLPKTDAEIREVLAKHGSGNQFADLPAESDEELEQLEIDEEEADASKDRSVKETSGTLPDAEERSETTPAAIEKSHTSSSTTSSSSAVPEQTEAEKPTDTTETPGAVFHASLLGTPDIASMTDKQPVGQSEIAGDELHSHETQSPTTSAGNSKSPSTGDFDFASPSVPAELPTSRASKLSDNIDHPPSPLNLSFQSVQLDDPLPPSKPNQNIPSAKLSSSRDRRSSATSRVSNATTAAAWRPTSRWVNSWQAKLPLQTIMRLLQVLVPQIEKICIEKGLTDESEILRFLQNGTLVGLLPVPHPILIRKYQSNVGTAVWFRTYIWGVIYLRNTDPPIWYDTNVRLFEVQRV